MYFPKFLFEFERFQFNFCIEYMKKLKPFKFKLAIITYCIDGLHLTSWRPCWRYNTKEYVINSIVGVGG